MVRFADDGPSRPGGRLPDPYLRGTVRHEVATRPDEAPAILETGPPSPWRRLSPVPRTRRDAALWLIFAVLGFAVGQLVATVATVVAADVTGNSAHLSHIAHLSAPPEWYVACSLIGLWVGFFGAPWLASMVRGTRSLVADLGLRFRWIDLWGIAIGAAGQLLVALMYAPFARHLHNFNAPTTKLTGASHGLGFLVIAVLTVLAAPFFEELFFRGLLLRAFLRFLLPAAPRPAGPAAPRLAGPAAPRPVGPAAPRLSDDDMGDGAGAGTALAPSGGAGAVVAVIASLVLDGVLFGLAHGELEQLAGLAAFGVILAIVAYRTGRLGMNMVAHASFNLVAVLVLVANGSAVVH